MPARRLCRLEELLPLVARWPGLGLLGLVLGQPQGLARGRTAAEPGLGQPWSPDLEADDGRELGIYPAAGHWLVFEDEAQAQEVESEIKTIKQRGRPSKEYVREFHRIDGKLRHWPKRLLVHFFKEGFDKELCHTCICWGVPDRIHDWYQMAVAMDLELHQHQKEAPEKKPKTAWQAN
ncbi:hypothetical protein E2320_022436 [Naja naja]|nr:hypothetical protein E2320_022436 [Naja naja]